MSYIDVEAGLSQIPQNNQELDNKFAQITSDIEQLKTTVSVITERNNKITERLEEIRWTFNRTLELFLLAVGATGVVIIFS